MRVAALMGVIYIAVILFAFIGWGRCVYKAVKCDWDPIGKAEVIYTVGVFTGAGAIIGWIDIEDLPTKSKEEVRE
jgi:hypothetical protein